MWPLLHGVRLRIWNKMIDGSVWCYQPHTDYIGNKCPGTERWKEQKGPRGPGLLNGVTKRELLRSQRDPTRNNLLHLSMSQFPHL